MPGVHRNSDSRACGAVTQSSSTKVRVNGRDIVLQGDNNSHGGGVIGHGGHGHCNPKATSASGNVNAG